MNEGGSGKLFPKNGNHTGKMRRIIPTSENHLTKDRENHAKTWQVMSVDSFGM
jgi:hypothetical protein